MKKTLLFLFLAISINSYSQLEYTFAKKTSTYSDLTAPNVLTGSWPLTAYLKLPFQFKYFSKNYDSLVVTPNNLAFTRNLSDFITMGMENYSNYVGTEISYLSTGATPNRIFKVQFKDLRVNVSDTSEEYFVNNQIWLYETTNVMEFHFGPNLITDINFTEFFFGFRDSDNSPYLACSGTPANTTFVQVSNIGTFKGMSAHPIDGAVYEFTPYKASTNITEQVKPYLFTNTGEAFSYLSTQNSTVTINDISGRQLSSFIIEANSHFKHDYSLLSSGLYLVTINSNNQLFTEKIIVQ